MRTTKTLKRVQFVALSLLSTISFSVAAEWVEIGVQNAETVIYVEYETIKESAGTVKLWSLSDYKVPVTLTVGKTLSSRSQYEFDCRNERIRRNYLSFHQGNMARGVALYVSSDVKDWQPIPPATISSALYKIACESKSPANADFDTDRYSGTCAAYLSALDNKAAGRALTMANNAKRAQQFVLDWENRVNRNTDDKTKMQSLVTEGYDACRKVGIDPVDYK